MSLFVGNISKDLQKQQLQDEFDKFGECEINFKVCRFLFKHSQNPSPNKLVAHKFRVRTLSLISKMRGKLKTLLRNSTRKISADQKLILVRFGLFDMCVRVE